MRRTARAFLAAALALAAPAAGAQTFDFESPPDAPPPPWIFTSGGVTATFSDPNNAYEVLTFPAGTFALLSGNVFGSIDADIFVDPLTVTFNTVLAGLTLDFALNDDARFPAPTSLTVQAFLGAVAVGAPVVAPAGMPPGTTYPEGSLSVAVGPFDRLVITSDAVDFFLDDITVRPAVVPEPATVTLLGLGLVGVGALARRRKARAVHGVA